MRESSSYLTHSTSLWEAAGDSTREVDKIATVFRSGDKKCPEDYLPKCLPSVIGNI